MNLPFFNNNKEPNIKPVVLIVMDGWGLAPDSEGNAIAKASTPYYDYLVSSFPTTELIAAGESVGLPANEDGNSEVGHLIIGVGRVVLQSLKRINLSIEESYFYTNKAFMAAAKHQKVNNSKLHILGMIGSGNVHSSNEHLFALLEFCKRQELKNVYLHLFTDGRDSAPKGADRILERIQKKLDDMKIGKIATVSGRYYAMDRDFRWERTQKTYEAMTLGKGSTAKSAVEAVRQSYSKGHTDEFVEPTVIVENGEPVAKVEDKDALIFFNFRVDRARQLTMAFTDPDFEKQKEFEMERGHAHELGKSSKQKVKSATFKRQVWPKHTFFVSMTEYQRGIPVQAIAFPPFTIDKPASQIISENGLKQLHLAESEKERMVTFYFDGLHEKAFEGTDVQIVTSPKVATYDKKPEMSLPGMTKEFLKRLRKDKYHFFVMNFANPDMVAHTGDIKATIRACEHVDEALNKMISKVLEIGGSVFITADHGNAEELLLYKGSSYFFTSDKGDRDTKHSNNPVPFIIVNKNLENKGIVMKKGSLSDVAPTILTFMGLSVPEVMSGDNLLDDNALSNMRANVVK